MLNNKEVYALILNYNSSSDTIALYNSLKSFAFKFLRIIVIDNDSESFDKDCLKRDIPLQDLLFNFKNLGYAGGNNQGIEIALKNNAQFIWLLNPDIRIEEETLPTLLEAFELYENLAAVGPRIIQRENNIKIFSDGEIIKWNPACSTFHLNFNESVSEIDAKINDQVDYIDGSSILLNSAAFREIGKLSQDYFLYFEETDWCIKARQKNWKILVNSHAVVYNLTSRKENVFHYYMMRNRLIFCRKFHPDFREVRTFYFNALLKELYLRLVKGIYLKPYYLSRVKGFLSGTIKTLSLK